MLGPLDGFVTGHITSEAGFRQAAVATTRSIFGTLGRRHGPDDVAVSLLYAHDRIAEAGSLPESWVAAGDQRANYTAGDFFAPDLIQLTARGNWQIGANIFRVDAYGRKNAIQQFNANVTDPNVREFLLNRSAGLTAEYTRPVRIGSRTLSATVGAEYSREDVHYRIDGEPTTFLPDTTTGECGVTTRMVCERAVSPTDNLAAYAQGIFSLSESWSVTGSVRADYVHSLFQDQLTPGNSGTSTFTRLSPKIGTNYRISSAVRGFASVSSGFRSPATLELACADPQSPCPLPFSLGQDPPLRPVVVWDYETGLDLDVDHGPTADVDVFDAEAQNEIVFVAPQRAAGFFQNIARTRRRGVEISGTEPLPHHLRAFASYTYLDATYQAVAVLASASPGGDSVSPGDHFSLTPRNRVRVGLGGTLITRRAVLDAQLVGSGVSSAYARGDEANREPQLPGYFLLGGRIALDTPHARVTLDLDNILNRNFVSFGVYAPNALGAPGGLPPTIPSTERFVTPGMPRTFTLAVTVKR
jgi:outer membrane receptor protein involved in Fe transport